MRLIGCSRWANIQKEMYIIYPHSLGVQISISKSIQEKLNIAKFIQDFLLPLLLILYFAASDLFGPKNGTVGFLQPKFTPPFCQRIAGFFNLALPEFSPRIGVFFPVQSSITDLQPPCPCPFELPSQLKRSPASCEWADAHWLETFSFGEVRMIDEKKVNELMSTSYSHIYIYQQCSTYLLHGVQVPKTHSKTNLQKGSENKGICAPISNGSLNVAC